jgi:hypothetical protein
MPAGGTARRWPTPRAATSSSTGSSARGCPTRRRSEARRGEYRQLSHVPTHSRARRWRISCTSGGGGGRGTSRRRTTKAEGSRGQRRRLRSSQSTSEWIETHAKQVANRVDVHIITKAGPAGARQQYNSVVPPFASHLLPLIRARESSVRRPLKTRTTLFECVGTWTCPRRPAAGASAAPAPS